MAGFLPVVRISDGSCSPNLETGVNAVSHVSDMPCDEVPQEGLDGDESLLSW